VRLNVALVSEHASPLATLGSVDAGGQNVYVASLARSLASRGDTVTIYTRRDDPALPRRVVFAPGVSVVHVPAGRPCHIDKDGLWPLMEEFADGLRAELAVDPPDVLHSHFWMSGWASRSVADVAVIPWIHTFHALGTVKRRHQGTADTSPAERICVERELAATADRIIATCTDEVFELSAMGTDTTRVTIVPCGLDPAVFSPRGPVAARRRGVRRLASVSRLVPRKGIADVILALAELPDCELVVLGGPPLADLSEDGEYRRLVGIAERAGVGERVSFRGGVVQQEVAAVLRSADLAVCAPLYEPFGIAPIEAMACGTPVVGTACGGLLDTVVPGETGVLVPPRDPTAISRAVRALLDDDHSLRRMSDHATHAARTRYAWSVVARRVDRVYHEVHRDVAEPAALRRRAS
jgi:D-inositol-3-phosphate glycosyltransferase